MVNIDKIVNDAIYKARSKVTLGVLAGATIGTIAGASISNTLGNGIHNEEFIKKGWQYNPAKNVYFKVETVANTPTYQERSSVGYDLGMYVFGIGTVLMFTYVGKFAEDRFKESELYYKIKESPFYQKIKNSRIWKTLNS